MNIPAESWMMVRRLLLNAEEAEATDQTKSRSIPAGIIPAFISEIDKELEYPGV